MTADPVQPEWMSALMALPGAATGARQFWVQYRSLAVRVTGAAQVGIYSRRRGQPGAPWQPLDAGDPDFMAVVPAALVAQLPAEALVQGPASDGRFAAVVVLPMGLAEAELVALFLWPAPPPARQAITARLATLAALPPLYEAQRQTRGAARDAQRFGQVLALVGAMQEAEGFDHAASVLANRMAELFACETAFVCWRARTGQQMRAISHGELPDRRSQESALVEECAQEALTQKTEVAFPATDAVVAFAAGRYAELAKPGHMLTLPMIAFDADGQSTELGAVTLCRKRGGFSAAEQWAARLMCELAQPVLAKAFQGKHWLPRRMGRELAASLPKALRARTVPGRVLLGAAAVALVALAVMPVPFRINATAVVKTDAMGFVGAPFSGYVAESDVIIGSRVAEGQVLFALSDAELVLEREGLLAELAQSNRDAEIKRSLGQLSEMLVAQARSEEIQARLVRLDRQIAGAEGRAPLAGVVVEGEPAKRLGEAVTRGDTLVTVAALSGLYLEAAVSERDLGFVEQGRMARLTLLANPRERFETRVQEVIPAASTQAAENVFPVRLSPDTAAPDWWLPGMTGVARIDAGRATLIWVATRRLRDMLRLWLWV